MKWRLVAAEGVLSIYGWCSTRMGEWGSSLLHASVSHFEISAQHLVGSMKALAVHGGNQEPSPSHSQLSINLAGLKGEERAAQRKAEHHQSPLAPSPSTIHAVQP